MTNLSHLQMLKVHLSSSAILKKDLYIHPKTNFVDEEHRHKFTFVISKWKCHLQTFLFNFRTDSILSCYFSSCAYDVFNILVQINCVWMQYCKRYKLKPNVLFHRGEIRGGSVITNLCVQLDSRWPVNRGAAVADVCPTAGLAYSSTARQAAPSQPPPAAAPFLPGSTLPCASNITLILHCQFLCSSVMNKMVMDPNLDSLIKPQIENSAVLF